MAIHQKDAHKDVESFDFLTMDEGRYTMSDGTIVEVGSFMLSGTREYKAVEFSEAFTAKHIFVFTSTDFQWKPYRLYARC